MCSLIQKLSELTLLRFLQRLHLKRHDQLRYWPSSLFRRMRGKAENFKLLIIACFPGGSDGEESAYNAGKLGLSPGLGRSPGEGHGNPLQYFCLENPMDRGEEPGRLQYMGLQRVRHN